MDFCRPKALVAIPVVELDMAVKGRSERIQYLAVVLAVLAGFGRGFHLKKVVNSILKTMQRNKIVSKTPSWIPSETPAWM